MLETYRTMEKERLTQGIPALPLAASQAAELCALLSANAPDSAELLDLLDNRVEPGVGLAAKEKAAWLEKVATGAVKTAALVPEKAIAILGRMGGGYNVAALIRLLEIPALAMAAADKLKHLTKIYTSFEKVARLALDKGNGAARTVLESWAKAEWFCDGPPLPTAMKLTVYKVDGEINTDDFSPGNQAQSRADIPLHATFFGKSRFPEGIKTIAAMRGKGLSAAFTGDVVGTGSSRKSAINSMAWHIGDDICATPNKRRGGVVLGGVIAPIFYATARDAGVLPLECEVGKLATGDEVTLDIGTLKLTKADGQEIAIKTPPETLIDEFRAGGRLNLIIGRSLTSWSCYALGWPEPDCFAEGANPQPKAGQGYTQAQKIIGRACGLPGVISGMNCQPKIATVGSQDTTGPMTVQELEELACLRFKTDLYMQSFCHTAAYPKAADLDRWQTMREAATARGGVALKPGDGIIHSWLNRMILPDTVGTGGDSHTRFPLGISFPAGSGLVAFAAALGFMPLEVPPSVLVRFHGKRRPGITVRDMVNAIPYFAMQKGMLTVAKKGKKNIFAGTILEIEGIDDLSAAEAFELSDASAERSAAACALALPLETVKATVGEQIGHLEALLAAGYQDADCLRRRIAALKNWLATPELLKRDDNAEFAAVLEIDQGEITEPLLACPNDPDDVKPLSAVAGDKIDEAFIGSCMVHLEHLRRVARLFQGENYAESRLWLAPPTRTDRDILQKEGCLSAYAQAGARVEIPGCSLCMGNQARVKPGATVISTSTRNFDNRLGDGTRVYLASSELTALAALYGRLPTAQEYFNFLKKKNI